MVPQSWDEQRAVAGSSWTLCSRVSAGLTSTCGAHPSELTRRPHGLLRGDSASSSEQAATNTERKGQQSQQGQQQETNSKYTNEEQNKTRHTYCALTTKTSRPRLQTVEMHSQR
jgi:hypothetical protein